MAALEAELDAMRAAAADGDIQGLLDHDVRFHRIIVDASGNETARRVWGSLRIEARTLITLIKSKDELPEIAEAHAPVVEAMRSGDGRVAGRALRKHIEAFAKWVPKDAGGA